MMFRRNELIAIGMFTFVLFCNSVLFGISRYIGETYQVGAFQTMFYYCAIGFVMIIPFIAFGEGFKAMATTRTKLHLTRAVLEFISFSITIYALSLITLPAHTALSFAMPIIASVTAIVILKEAPTHHTWVGIALGLAGVLVITEPWEENVDLRGLIMLAAGLGFSLCGVSIKLLTSTETPNRVAFYMLFLTTIIFTPFAFNFITVPNISAPWVPIDAVPFYWLLGIGVCALVPQILIAKALSRVPFTTVIPLNFLMLLFTSIIAYFFFDELITPETMIGATIIIIATMYSSYGSARKAAMTDEPIV